MTTERNPLSALSRKTFLASMIMLAAAGTALVGAPAQAGRELTNSELRMGTTQEFENLNPIIAIMVVSTYLLGAVDRTEVVYLDANNQWQPQAAERIPTLENGDAVKFTDKGVEKIKVTWRIRKEARWGDGKPLTGNDYKFGWTVGSSDKVSVPTRDFYTDIENFEVDKSNPKNFTVTYKKARWDFFKIMTRALPEHLEGAVFAKFGSQPEGYDRNSKYTTDAANKGLYSGPYRVAQIKLGSHVELVRNENWWGPTKPTIEKILLRLIPNSATLESNLVSGNIDYIMTVGLSLDEAIAFENRVKSEKLPYVVDFIDSQIFEHIDLNLDNPLFKDPRTRQALLHAIDREGLTQALFKGKQKVAQHFIHPSDPWFTDAPGVVAKYEYSPRKARSLLTAAGFVKGPSGFLELNGKPFKIVFQTTAGNKVRENVQVFIKNQLAQVGVDVEIKNQPAKVFFGDIAGKRKFDGMIMYAWTSSSETDPTQTYATSSIPSAKNSWAGSNYMGWSNAKVDKAITEVNAAFSLDKRKEIMKTILSEYTRELPSLPLYYRASITVLPAALTGVKTTSHQYSETYAIENWRVKTDQLSKK